MEQPYPAVGDRLGKVELSGSGEMTPDSDPMVGYAGMSSPREGATFAEAASTPAGAEVAEVDGVGVFVDGELGQADAQTGPVLGHND